MAKHLRILLFAAGDSGLGALRALCQAGHTVVECFTSSAIGISAPALVDACRELGIPCVQDAVPPDDISNRPGNRPDLLLCVGYRRLIPSSFLSMPRLAAVNLHPAPLPAYRGSQVIRWGLINQAPAWEVTAHLMTDSFNEGAVLLTQPMAIRSNDNAYDRSQQCTQAIIECAIRVVDRIATDHPNFTLPNAPASSRGPACFYGPDLPFNGNIDWTQPASRIAAFVRAMDFGHTTCDGGYAHLGPPAQAALSSRTIGIFRARPGGVMSAYPPGTITRCDQHVWVQTAQGHLAIEKIVAPDERGRVEDHDAANYFHRHGFAVGMSFDLMHRWPEMVERVLVRAA